LVQKAARSLVTWTGGVGGEDLEHGGHALAEEQAGGAS
jgi:hypothetical protein